MAGQRAHDLSGSPAAVHSIPICTNGQSASPSVRPAPVTLTVFRFAICSKGDTPQKDETFSFTVTAPDPIRT